MPTLRAGGVGGGGTPSGIRTKFGLSVMAVSGGRAMLIVAWIGANYYCARRSPQSLVMDRGRHRSAGRVRPAQKRTIFSAARCTSHKRDLRHGKGKSGRRSDSTRRLKYGFRNAASVSRSIGRPDRASSASHRPKYGVFARRQWLETDQEVEVATNRIEVVAGRRRTEQVQTADVKAAAELG
jgi:hypothetical protein